MTGAATSPPPGAAERLLTFRSGGWLIALTLLVCATLITWALAPAILRLGKPLLGDGKTPESYGFDLANLQVPRHLIVPGMRHRDMVVPIDAPVILDTEEIALNTHDLVNGDRVIGVVVNGEARAYPITVLNVHEIIHDTLGGRPIAVTW